MKTLQKALTAILLTASLLLTASVAALADDVAESEELQPLTIEGMTQIVVTSSDSNGNVDASNFYDGTSDTRCKIGFGAEEEEKTFSVYTATKIPEALSAFATILDGEPGVIITISAYGTNDSLLIDWTPLALSEDIAFSDEYAIFTIADEPTTYAFYRFDFTLEYGESFEIAELALFKLTTDEPEMEYAYAEVVEAGETLPLVPVETAEEEEVAVDAEFPAFGLFRTLPLAAYKFLPRG